MYSLSWGEEGFHINRSILLSLGFSKISWYSEPLTGPPSLFLVNTIKNAGYGSILYLSAIVAIDPEYFEAARINGANKWQQIIHITLPMVSNMIIILIILNLGYILTGDFGLFYNVPLRSTYLRQATEIIDIYVYRMLQGGRMEVSTASSLLKSIIGMITVLSANALVRRIDSEKAMV
jgi:putative aldouronate transport system permease protein